MLDLEVVDVVIFVAHLLSAVQLSCIKRLAVDFR
jgi:hypothetical protein